MLSGKQILITGVVTTDSIAFAVARRAHELGAQVLLTGFPRDLDRTRDAVEQLPGRVDVVPFDATDADDTARLAETISERWGHLDGALHAIAFAPADALSGPLRRPAGGDRPGLPDQHRVPRARSPPSSPG